MRVTMPAGEPALKAGSGLVATGTDIAGEVGIGDEVKVLLASAKTVEFFNPDENVAFSNS